MPASSSTNSNREKSKEERRLNFFQDLGLSPDLRIFRKNLLNEYYSSLHPRLRARFGRKLRRFGITYEIIKKKSDGIYGSIVNGSFVILVLLILITHSIIYTYQTLQYDSFFTLPVIQFFAFFLLSGFLSFVLIGFLILRSLRAISKIKAEYREFLGLESVRTIYILMILAFITACAVYYPVYLWRESPIIFPRLSLQSLVLNFLSMAASTSLAFIFLTMAVSTFADSVRVLVFSRIPVAYLSVQLLDLIEEISTKEHKWNEISFKNELSLDIEKLSTNIEHLLGKHLRGYDNETKLWLSDHFREIALAFRSKKRLIFNPSIHSRSQLLGSLTRSLYNLVEGNWSRLETQPESSLTLREESWRRIKTMWKGIKTLILSAVPLSLVYLLQFVPGFNFPEPYYSYAKIFGVIWIAVSLIISIDPLYNSKLDLISKGKGLFGTILGDKGKD